MACAYRYKARDRAGKSVSGTVESESVDDVARLLVVRGLYPTAIDETVPYGKGISAGVIKLFAYVSDEEKIIFTSQLSALLKAGVPIISSLGALHDQTDNPRFKEALKQVKQGLEEGLSLTEAMSKNKDIFSGAYLAMITAGETTGSLDRCLEYLAEMLKREFELKNRIREITLYPKIAFAAVVTAMVILLTFVVPRYAAIFEKAKLKLPVFTEALIWLDSFFQNHWIAGVQLALTGFVAARLAINTQKGRMIFDRYVLSLPVTGDITLKISLARWSNALGSLIRGGTPIIKALAISSRTAGNESLICMLNNIADEVSDGGGLAEPLRRHRLLPPVVAQMAASGEESGSLDEMLLDVSRYLEDDARRNIRKLAAYIEPAMILGMGLVVLFLALSIFLPMWDITKMARGGF
ncbi:MAG TPA: type II secretion system F family protein [Nitrospirae bacterium]|nr:type II secretion system F family protein [Nitrospirota bacterium]